MGNKKTMKTAEKKKTTHALPVDVLERLRIHAVITQRDQQDIVAEILDKYLPVHPLKHPTRVA